jgi:hypothetical protein
MYVYQFYNEKCKPPGWLSNPMSLKSLRLELENTPLYLLAAGAAAGTAAFASVGLAAGVGALASAGLAAVGFL